MGKRMITGIAAAVFAAASAVGMFAAPATAAPGTAVAQAAKPGAPVDRNVRRTAATLGNVSAAFALSPGCSGTTLPISCTITEPVVTQHEFTYPFAFLPGDRVTVAAGGCVQTGGHGQTWKRYVDPAADNDLYHGLITIPNTTGTLQRLVDVVGRQYVVGGRGGSLTLGYDDDGYGDNGYYAHDNGTGGQCTNSVNAFVTITIS
jgi:hypothetical protein